jgi:hypothetical protein
MPRSTIDLIENEIDQLDKEEQLELLERIIHNRLLEW